MAGPRTFLVPAVGVVALGAVALSFAFRAKEDRFLITGSSTVAPGK